MPNSSSALPASRIISRSESLPITMETSGLLMNIRSSKHRYGVLICPLLSLRHHCQSERSEESRYPLEQQGCSPFGSNTRNQVFALFLQRSGRNIFAVMCSIEADFRARVIGAPHRTLQLRRPCTHTQHASPRRKVSTIALRRPRVEDLHAIDFGRLPHSGNFLSRIERARISSRRHHNTHRSIRRPFEVPVANATFDGSFASLDQIALQPHQNRLRLRIAKAAG